MTNLISSFGSAFVKAFQSELAIFKASQPKQYAEPKFFSNVAKEIIATRDYSEAKRRGVILVSQDW